MQKLTVIIPTYNEAENLKELLPLVSWADELLVVDSFSEDDSVEIANAFGAKVLERKYENSANQKNWTIPQAKNEWILLIDADERPTEALIKEVKAILATKPEEEAFWIGRDNYFMNKQIRFSGWQGDAVIRLFKRDHCRYEEKAVHAEIITNGKVGRLTGRLKHYTYKSMQQFLRKMERYAVWSAKDYAQKTKKITFYHLNIKPAFRFFKHYILKQGFRDGKVGFIVCKVLAWGVFLRYVMMQEMRNKGELD
jgi:glycosyltransferase involved in cell wall biosynthesis